LDPNPTIQGIDDPQTTNDTEYNFTDIYGGLRYRLKAGIFTFTPGFTLHAYNSKNIQYGTASFQDTFAKFLPEFEAVAQFKRSESLTLTYKQEVNFTDVNQIAKGIVANSYSSFFTGNADLINASFHNVSLRYSSFNLFNASNIFARVNYRKTIDQIATDVNFIPGSVVSTRSNLNAPDENETFTAFGRIGKTIKKIRTSIGGSFTYNKNYRFINTVGIENKLFNQSYNTSIGSNFTKAPNLSLKYNVSFTTQQDASRPIDVKSVTHSPSINFDAYVWNSLTITSDFSFNEVRQNGNVANSFKIWDAKLAYRKDKDAKWEYELVGSNLLATGSRASVSQNNISFNINETFILPRFVSLRVRYQL
jgi:hypothetical protein